MAQDRYDRRAESALTRDGNTVALFLDYENVRHSIEHHFDPPPTQPLLCEKLLELSSRFGHVLLANAYGDWSLPNCQPREFRRRQIEPRLVLTKENGDDRTDITMSMDALETLYVEPEIDVYVVASGDSDFHDLLQRLRRRGKRIVVCAVRSDTGRELIRGADKFVALEELLGIRTGRSTEPVRWEEYDWTNFIRLIRDLDRKLNFVGLRYVATKVLNPHNCGLSDRSQKQELLNRAIDSGIIDPYQVENIEEGGEPVSACRLNEENPLVAETLRRLEEAEEAAEAAATTAGTEESPEPAPKEEEPSEAAEERAPRTTPAVGRRSFAADGDDMGRPGETS